MANIESEAIDFEPEEDDLMDEDAGAADVSPRAAARSLRGLGQLSPEPTAIRRIGRPKAAAFARRETPIATAAFPRAISTP
ncbi:hypothetical protein HID58_095983 [Brassica napus]|uniref:Uncharacterized protein n=1 Tax=Brassica napus TaxID=3708 RepID=A0ABQ7X1Y7_BRANA|nr:hypothetical protein HID58_095983 [Brassica napus]